MDRFKNSNKIFIVIGIVIFSIIVSFFTSIFLLYFIDEFLRSNWQYQLFEDNKSYIMLRNYIMFMILLVEITLISIFYKKTRD
ncbi:hypothetical protein [Romboutsia sp. MSSM.1001216sp_RTP31141st1_G3_RTP31141_220114]|uniref:hypothetical protein n=1 Tax=unclassified Romboutsia TaxID=2626894 RepID=UPI0031B5EB03